MTADAAADAGVRFSVDGELARVILDRPERRNAQHPRMWLALAEFGEALPASVRVVVVSGRGPAFSSGLDRSMFADLGGDLGGTDSEALQTIAGYQAGFAWLRRPEFISVAAVQGHAIGAGFQLALACDVRLVTRDAQFTMAEPGLGLVPDLGGTQALVDAVGYSRAVEICATGRRVGADEAQRIGLANLVVGADDLDGAVDDLGAALRTTVHGAVTMTKALLLGARNRSYEQQLLAERQTQLMRIRALTAESTYGSSPQP